MEFIHPEVFFQNLASKIETVVDIKNIIYIHYLIQLMQLRFDGQSALILF